MDSVELVAWYLVGAELVARWVGAELVARWVAHELAPYLNNRTVIF